MTEHRRFPEIVVTKDEGSGYEGLAGLKLNSLLVGELLKDSFSDVDNNCSSTVLDQKKFQVSRQRLLHAISSWPSNVSLEMQMSVLPDLGYKAQGRVKITLFIRVAAQKKETVKERLIHYYISLMHLLIACLPEAEFLPITNVTELNQRRAPFSVKQVSAIFRKYEKINLASPLKKLAIGFNAPEEAACNKDTIIEHVFPTFSPMDLMGLPNYQGYCRTQLRGEPTPPMSFKTEMIDTPYDEQIAGEIIKMSCQKYGRARAEIEAQIKRRNSIWKEG